MPLKLAMVSVFPENPDTVRGGVESVANSLVEGLGQFKELEIHLVSPSRRSREEIELRNGLIIHWIKDSKLPGFLGYWTSFRRTIHRTLNKIQPDVTHFQGVAGWTLRYNHPYVFTIHGIAERDIVFRKGLFLGVRKTIVAFIERLGRKQASHTILISPYVEEILAGQVIGKRWHIDNPVTDELFQVKRTCHEARLLYVGRLNERKNILKMLEVFQQVLAHCPSVCLHIAGEADDPAYLKKCLEFLREKRIQESVRFLGNISRSMLLEEFSRAACLMLISHQETAPMVVMEAMAAGVPVIVSNICGLPYIVQEGVTGFLVGPDDTRQIVERAVTLLTNPDIVRNFGTSARKTALSRFHARAVAEKTLMVYRDALQLRHE